MEGVGSAGGCRMGGTSSLAGGVMRNSRGWARTRKKRSPSPSPSLNPSRRSRTGQSLGQWWWGVQHWWRW